MLEVVDQPVHHVDSLEVDERLADLQAEQHQRDVRQRALVLCQVGAELQEHRHQVSNGFNQATYGFMVAAALKVTDLSVRVELHDDPHRTFLNDSNQFDDVLMIEVLHNDFR